MSARTVTVFSNKGGVGKTFITVNLATALSMVGKRVLLLDLDFQAGQDMARMINVTPKHSMADVISVLEHDDSPEMIKNYSTVYSTGLSFLPVIKNTQQLGVVNPDSLNTFLEKAAEYFEYIIVDAGKGYSESLISVFDFSNLLLLVATPDILAVYQIKSTLDVLQSLQYPTKMIKLVLNRSESRGSVAWQEVRSALPCEIFAHVPSDGKLVGTALNRGIPCVVDNPKSRVSESFSKMVKLLRLEDIYVEATGGDREQTKKITTEEPGDFWKKFGVTQGQHAGEKIFTKEEDSIISLKKNVHEKLIERLNLEGITVDALSDPQSAAQVKKRAETVVASILAEEAGGKIASHEQRVELVNDIVNEAFGLGPLEDLLVDPDITDIMCNNQDEIYVEKKGKLLFTNKRFISRDKMRAIIDRIIAPLGRRIDESTPMVDARLPDGSRVNAIIPPLALNGPMLTIRKFGQERLTIDDLLNKYKSINKDIAYFLQACVRGRKNMIISGGTGAGKTTVLNVVSEFIPDGERIITIEDAAELRLKKSHWGRLESRPSNVEGKGSITIRDLFINTLRMRPDRIVIGECRGPEVLDMLQAMNTGHDGSLTTLHANSTRDAITRLSSMILLSGLELPIRAINEMVASALDLIIHVARFSDGTRKVTGVTEVVGLTPDRMEVALKDIFIFNNQGVGPDGAIQGDYEPTGYIPICYDDLVTRGLTVDKQIFHKKANTAKTTTESKPDNPPDPSKSTPPKPDTDQN
jgi:septum site-determining protein MinD